MIDAELQRISMALDKYPAVDAYLFGSAARGDASPLSDIDIAVLLDASLSKNERFDLRLQLSGEFSSLLARTIDLIILNDAPMQLAFEIIKYGKIITCRDNAARVEFERQVISRYLDRRFYDKRRAEVILGQIASRGLQSP